MPARPSMAVLVPTYNRVADIGRLLETLQADPDARASGVAVLVADNGSGDGTPDAVRAIQAAYPDMPLELQEHGENLGAVANVAWLIENAPEVDYLWLFGDDDLPVPGAIGAVLDLLAQRPVAMLHLPHTFERDGEVMARSACPARTEYYPSSRELSRVYHHWATFLSASVVNREALVRAARDLPTANEWAPHIWYLNAGRDAECAVFGGALVRGGMDIAWQEQRVTILTDRVIEAFDAGLDRVIDAREFAQYLDDFYPDVGREPWAQVPIERLVAALERFPHSRELSGMLFSAARAQGRADALEALDAAVRGAGAEAQAASAVAEGEALFAAGDLHGALERFRAALRELPTSAEAWNDLGVVLHAAASPEAGQAFEVALALDPAHADARDNHALIAAGTGRALV